MPAEAGYEEIGSLNIQGSKKEAAGTSKTCKMVAVVLLLVALICIFLYFGGIFNSSSANEDDGSSEDEYLPLEDERPMYLQPEFTANTNAICNDGGIPHWHYREPLGSEHEYDWIFRFEGGSACFSNLTCHTRWEGVDNDFMIPATTDVIFQDPEGGVLHGSPQVNPDFHDWNAVHMHYCSSDSWMGSNRVGENGNDSPYHYMGYHVMMGIFDELEAKPEYGFSQAKNILITGFSAGGLSSLSLAQELHDKVQSIAPDAFITHLSDSGWFLSSLENVCEENMDCLTYNNCPLNTQYQWQIDFAGHVYNEDCAASYGDDDKWMCAFPEYSYPFLSDEVKDNTILVEAMYDQMNHDLHVGTDCEYDEDAYWVTVREALMASYEASEITNYVSSSCTNHDHTCKQWYYDIVMLDNIAVNEHVMTWLTEEAGTGSSYQSLDNCTLGVDTDCNPTCPVHTLPNHVD